ncbi:MAG: GFA family protein [Gammaproteobacteria bacterium]
MAHGRCLCGDIAFEVEGPLKDMTHCHCSMCRIAHGSVFATYVGAPSAGFRWTKGEDRVAWYESSPGFMRTFCPNCGSVLPTGHPENGDTYFPAGLLEDGCDLKPAAHIFTKFKLPWVEIDESLMQFEQYPPGAGETVERDPPPARDTGTAGGECLCGAVAFEYDGEPAFMWNCHCSRCRLARGAAHATNVFVATESFRWLRGEDNVVTYKLPEAERFGQAFCKTCGSKVPRVRDGAPYVVVPAGAVDGDPGARPTGHIYADSKASWYDIPDSLPRHAEAP